MKFKCKLCHKKHKVSSLNNAHKEISCNKIACPIFNTIAYKQSIGIESTVKKEEDFSPRREQLLEFDQFDEEPFHIVTNWETPEPPKIVVQAPINSDDYNGWYG